MNLDLMALFSRNDLRKIKDGAYVINLYEKIVKQHIRFHYLFVKME